MDSYYCRIWNSRTWERGLFEKMLGLKPDGFTFVGVLMACNHAGMVEEGLRHFKQMQPLYEIEPKLEHYAHARSC